jgi:hypothetical protein
MASLVQRKNVYYLQWYTAGHKINRRSLETTSYQIAKERLRKFESSQYRGETNSLPTKTPLTKSLNEYVRHMASFKTAKSVQTDVYYLRAMFGDDAQSPLRLPLAYAAPRPRRSRRSSCTC